MSSETSMTIPDVHTFQHIFDRAKQLAKDKGAPRAALVVPSDDSTLKAFASAADRGLIDPTLIGDESLAKDRMSKLDIVADKFKFINLVEPDMAVKTSVKMASAGELDLLVAGRILPISFLKVLLDKSFSFLPKGRVLSHVGVMKPSRYEKLLLITDAAVNMEPDLKCKLALIDNAVSLASKIGLTMPRVALIAAVEVVYPQMPVTTDAAIIAKMSDRKQIKGAYVDGPLSFDVAVDMVAAHGKGIKNSPVAGQADILVAPNIETANGVYKAMSLYGRAEVGGVICGGKTPVIFCSRSESETNRLNSIALGVLAAVAK